MGAGQNFQCRAEVKLARREQNLYIVTVAARVLWMHLNKGECMSTGNINLYAKEHAIESEQFMLAFQSPLDTADGSLFDEKKHEIEDLFKAIDEPGTFRFMIGSGSPPPEPVFKILNDYGRNGKPEWSGQFGENVVSVSSMQYTNWGEIWPSVKQRLNALLSCVNHFKFVGSIDYKVTDTLTEQISPEAKKTLLSKNILKKGRWVPERLLSYTDPRWDFSSGFFHESNSKDSEILERIEARSYLRGDHIVTSISNNFSLKIKEPVRLKELLQNSSVDGRVAETFEKFHEENKVTIKSILSDDLLDRIGLGQ